MEIWNPGYTEFTYFWHGPFSQWFYSYFKIDGICYSHAEQWMMAEKARLFKDEKTERLILKSADPREQKKLGRMVANFELDKWNSVCKNIVYRGNAAKFLQNEDLLKKLKDTDGTLLVEASPFDTVWGIGLSEADVKQGKPWRGTNWLGEVLTKLREDLNLSDSNQANSEKCANDNFNYPPNCDSNSADTQSK